MAQTTMETKAETKTENLGDELLRIGAKILLEEILEANITEYLGGEPYRRVGKKGTPGYRSGYKSRVSDTAEGRLQVDLPQVRDTDEPYRPELWDAMKRRTDVLKSMVVEMYAHGLSTRDIEETLSELSGGEGSLLSKSSVSRITEVLWEEYEAFSKRDLSGFDVVYLFADTICRTPSLQIGIKEGILVTWAILSDGSKVLLSMTVGNKESYGDWLEHFRDLVSRELPVPFSVTTDGAPGLTRAVDTIWPKAERICCWFHKMRNILDNVPTDARDVVKSYLEAVRDAPDYESGKLTVQTVISMFEKEYPTAIDCLKEDLDASLAHLRFPLMHRKSIHTTNLVVRNFEEEGRIRGNPLLQE